ncbi:MAG TPA: hypothetical protein VFU48_05245, partial [Nitrospira sp.]|nr:hypothetical protein [Nitrospira sp.]
MNNTWTRDQLLVAFNLYCKIPFSKTKANNPSVIRVARLINRSPASVAMKLGNFGSFDPALQSKGITGLSRTSRADREIWDEFNQDWDKLSMESELAVERLGAGLEGKLGSKSQVGLPASRELSEFEEVLAGPSETARLVKVRLHQRFFRESVLASYGSTCCVCANPIPQLLTAGHIVPWS